MNLITIADLERLNACSTGLDWARSVVPAKGMPYAAFNQAIPRADWLIWWLDKSGQANARQLVMLGVVAARPSVKHARPVDRAVIEAAYRAAENWARNPTPHNADAAAWAAAGAAAAESAAWAVDAAARAGMNPQESADLCRSYMATEEYQRLGEGK